MFTGIIEAIGRIKRISLDGTNRIFWIESPLFPELKIDQSLSHDGVCLTVEDLKEGVHKVTAVKETLDKTTLERWKEGDSINLERSLLLSSRLDGHFVQGHVDGTCILKKISDKNGSWELDFEFAKKL